MIFLWLLPLLALALLASRKDSKPSGWVVTGIGALLVLPLLAMSFPMMIGGTGYGPGRGMMMGARGPWVFSGYGSAAYSSGYGWIGPVSGLAMLIGLGLVGYYLLKRLPSPSNSALEVLKTRLARGEVTLEEYEALKQRIAG